MYDVSHISTLLLNLGFLINYLPTFTVSQSLYLPSHIVINHFLVHLKMNTGIMWNIASQNSLNIIIKHKNIHIKKREKIIHIKLWICFSSNFPVKISNQKSQCSGCYSYVTFKSYMTWIPTGKLIHFYRSVIILTPETCQECSQEYLLWLSTVSLTSVSQHSNETVSIIK